MVITGKIGFMRGNQKTVNTFLRVETGNRNDIRAVDTVDLTAVIQLQVSDRKSVV